MPTQTIPRDEGRFQRFVPTAGPKFKRFWGSYYPLPCAIYSCIPYGDTVALFFRRYPPNVRDRVEAAGCGKVFIRPREKGGHCDGWMLWVHQPSLQAILVLDQLQHEYRATLSRLAIAFEFFTIGDVVTLHEWLLKHMVLKWRRAGSMEKVANAVADTAYWVDQSKRKRPPTRDLLPYCDHLSKVNGQPCARVELRFIGSTSIKRHGYGQAKSLLTLNPEKLFRRHIKLLTCQGWDRYITRIIRKKVRADRLSHLNHPPRQRQHPLVDQYRMEIPERVRGYYSEITQGDKMQRVKDLFPHLGFETVSLEHLKLASELQYVGH